MINFHFSIDFLETQDVFIALVYGNSDLLSTSPPVTTNSQAILWAEGCITGIKLARGEV